MIRRKFGELVLEHLGGRRSALTLRGNHILSLLREDLFWQLTEPSFEQRSNGVDVIQVRYVEKADIQFGIEPSLPMLHFSATAGYSVEALFFASFEIKITMVLLALKRSDKPSSMYLLNAAIWKGGHPELGLVSAILELLGNARPSCLLEKRKVDQRANVGIVVDQLPLVGAPASCDLAKKAFPCFANAVRGATRRLLQVVENRCRCTRHLA